MITIVVLAIIQHAYVQVRVHAYDDHDHDQLQLLLDMPARTIAGTSYA
jgi:hypothetical protein